MKTADGFQQTDNAPAAVEIGSRLIPSASLRAGSREAVTDAPNDKEQLRPTRAALSPVVESVAAVLIDSGFYSAAAVAAAEQSHGGAPAPKIYAATGRTPHGRTIAPLEQRADPPEPGADASARQIMAHRLATRAGRTLYAQRQQTIEPVFGIIKAALGFRRLLAPSGTTLRAAFGRLSRSARLSLRGLPKVRTEGTLVTLADNLKRLSHLGADLAAA